eukprot:5758610-Pyramimonas_sp.AAC.1
MIRSKTSRRPQGALDAKRCSLRLQVPSTLLIDERRGIAGNPHGVLQEALGDLFGEEVGLVGRGLEAVQNGFHRLEVTERVRGA